MNLEEFLDDFYMAFVMWITRASADDACIKGLLSNVKRHAVALHHSLEKLHQRLEQTAWQVESGKYDEDYDLDLAALERLPPSNVAQILKELSALSDAAERLCLPVTVDDSIPKSRGRRRGVKCYPGLRELVFCLEETAQAAGGAFTVHRKLGAKGSLVQALDWFRDRVLASPELNHLADYLPTRGKHPVALYERALKAARKHALTWESPVS